MEMAQAATLVARRLLSTGLDHTVVVCAADLPRGFCAEARVAFAVVCLGAFGGGGRNLTRNI